MISEHKFSSSFTSVWHEVTPLGEGYWSLQRLMVERKMAPIKNKVPSRVRGLVNELAFMAFAEADRALQGRIGSREHLRRLIEALVPSAIDYVNRVGSRSDTEAIYSLADVDDDLIREGMLIALRLMSLFRGKNLSVRPKFKGCGMMSAAEGDVIFNGCLFEVKAGDRNFRITDVRQLLIYSALAYASNQQSFEEIGLFNPRTGQWWVRSLDAVCRDVAGLTSVDVLARLVDHFSPVAISR